MPGLASSICETVEAAPRCLRCGAEFVRQSALLANIWTGLGAATASVVEPDRHPFTIVDGLADRDHPLTAALLTETNWPLAQQPATFC